MSIIGKLHSKQNTDFNINRFPAEWEKQSFIQFTFPHRDSDWAYMYESVVACFVEIIYTTAQFEPVLIVCHSTNEVASYFSNPTPFPIYFIEIESNDTWARDHGAITTYENGLPILNDFEFNGWGKKFEAALDNKITEQLSEKVLSNVQRIPHNFVLEGGAIESDGLGTLLTTSECLLSPHRNPHLNKNQITEFLIDTLSIKKVLWLDHGFLAGDDTDSHIDTLARICNPTTIAYVKCPDPDDEHFEALQKMEQQLQSFTNANNETYTLIALPWPDACFDSTGERLPATYANFLIVNNAVLVPIYNLPQDQEAIKIIQNIFPNRKVLGINCRPLIDQHGSLHCITMQYPENVKLVL